jgi:hypothetical protein
MEIPDDAAGGPVDSTFRTLIELCWSFNPSDRPSFRDVLKFIATKGKPSKTIGI